MSAMAVTPPIGLIDHLPDAEVTFCIPPAASSSREQHEFHRHLHRPARWNVLRCRQWLGWQHTVKSGVFIVTVSVSASNSPVLTKNYPLLVALAGAILSPHSAVDTGVSPATAGTTTGDGVYTNGTTATVTATPNAGLWLFELDGKWRRREHLGQLYLHQCHQSIAGGQLRPAVDAADPRRTRCVIAWVTNFSGCRFAAEFRSAHHQLGECEQPRSTSSVGIIRPPFRRPTAAAVLPADAP